MGRTKVVRWSISQRWYKKDEYIRAMHTGYGRMCCVWSYDMYKISKLMKLLFFQGFYVNDKLPYVLKTPGARVHLLLDPRGVWKKKDAILW